MVRSWWTSAAPWMPAVLGSISVVFLLAGPRPADGLAWTPGVGTPTAEVEVATLFETTFSPDALPAGPAGVALWRLTLAPGASGTSRPGSLPIDGVGFEYVEAGACAVRADGLALVKRPGRAAETGEAAFQESVPAGTEMMLGAGDGVLYPDRGTARRWRNVGEAPVVVIGVSIGTPMARATSVSTGVEVEVLGALSAADWARLPAGPAVATLRRATLPAGTTLPAPAQSALEILHVEAGTLEWSVVRPADPATPGDPLSVSAGESVPFAGAPSGTAAIARNAGNTPAVVLDLTVVPAGPGAALGPRSRSLASIPTYRRSLGRIGGQAPFDRPPAAMVRG